MNAKAAKTGRGAKAPRSRLHKAALRKARELNQALIKSAEKPAKKKPMVGADAKKKPTAPAVAKWAPKKTVAPKKRFKVDGLVKREGNSFDHTKAVHNVLMAAWTDRLMMSSDRARALSTALGIAFSCGLVTTLCGLTFGRQVLITNKGIDFLNWSLGPSAQKALYTKKKRAVHGGDVAGAIQDYQPNNID
jgi:hypothetical protein